LIRLMCFSTLLFIDGWCIQFDHVHNEVMVDRAEDLCLLLEGKYEAVKTFEGMENIGENRYGTCLRAVFMNAVGKTKDYFDCPDKVCDAIGRDAWIANVDKEEEIMRQYYVLPDRHEMGSIANHAAFSWKPEDLESPLFEKLAEVLPRFAKAPPKFKYAAPGDFTEEDEEEFKECWVIPDVEVEVIPDTEAGSKKSKAASKKTKAGSKKSKAASKETKAVSKKTKAECGSPEMLSPAKRSKR
jgi:hypothetical protein